MTEVAIRSEAALLRRSRPYSEYRDSGVRWLGQIPSHWEVKRLSLTVTACQNGVWGSEADGIADTVCVRVADFDRLQFRVNLSEPTLRSIDPEVAKARKLRNGDLLLEKSGGGEKQPVGALVVYDHEQPAVCSNFVARMPVSDSFHPRYLAYLHAALYAARINTRSIKQSTGIQNLDSASYLSEPVGLPNSSEQRAIANFLDRKTAEIDALVAKKEQLTDLLQEKRTALITRAVTRGLDPNVHMKDSGVEWLGEIPVHWEEARVWRLCSATSGATPTKDNPAYWNGNIPWVSPKDMKRRLIDTSRDLITQRALEETGIRLVDPGAVLVVVRGMILAHSFPVALATAPVTVNQDMKALRLVAGIDTSYFAWTLDGLARGIIATVVEEAAHGTRAIRMDQWRNVVCPVPPYSEQLAIAHFLDHATVETDALIAKMYEAIDHLHELRTALISAAVTGKIDVREATPQ